MKTITGEVDITESGSNKQRERPVSYTHLDVYKRQTPHSQKSHS